MITRIGRKLKEWYGGKYVPPPENDPDSPVVIISPGHYEQPFLAKCLKVIVCFWLNHWKWIIATGLAIIGLVWAITHTK